MANIFIYDEFNPEDGAMLQALYSRSPKSVSEHVEKVRTTGSGKFMETFYVGYGHASIADCGSTTIFIEKVSILADKAIQDWQSYSGQETSTRYIDMSRQEIIDPIGNEESRAIIKAWMDFYTANQEELQAFLKEKYPRRDSEDENVYLKAIKARSFDIMRGFLPAGICTQLSWHTNLRQAWDKLAIMRHHPLSEVREIAEQILLQLREKYPHSFSHPENIEHEKYRAAFAADYTYFQPEEPVDFSLKANVDREELRRYQRIIDSRPTKIGLPIFLAELGTCRFDFTLDFGSFRDLQRHRNGICRMPLLETTHGFNSWYLEQLPESLRQEALTLIEMQTERISKLETTPEIKQYYIAMGFNVAGRVTYALPAAAYVIELRSGRLVHPTLRKLAQQMYQAVKEEIPELKLYPDLEADDWDIRRGLADITNKA